MCISGDLLCLHLVCCSAGVGRSGTLMGIDIELQRARQEGIVDPFNLVLVLRRQRNHMVQTEVRVKELRYSQRQALMSAAKRHERASSSAS